MSSIRIIAVPPGPADEGIRKEWVDIVIPLPSEEALTLDPPSGFSIGMNNAGGYHVLLKDAVASLRNAGKDEIADLWESLPVGKYLRFKREVCEVIA